MREFRDIFYLRLALLIATRGTCWRRQVGGVAVNARGHVLSTGYNGVPSGLSHCRDGPLCAGARAPSGTDLDLCMAVHCETNLLAQCSDVQQIHMIYLTCSPCFNCVKALITSGCQRLVFLEEYPHPEAGVLWRSTGREWVLAEPLAPLESGEFW